MPTFAEQTAVHADGADNYRTSLVEGWDIGSVTNGGYVLALVVRAMLDAVDKSDPVSVNAHYERPGYPGPATIRIERGRQGRTLSTVGAVLIQDGKEVIRTMGTFANTEQMEGPELILANPPTLSPRDECVRAVRESPDSFYPPPFVDRFDIRHDPKYIGFASGNPAGEPTMGGWLSLLDDEPLDAVALTMFADAFPPTIFNTDLPVGWAPTIELTVHYRQRAISAAVAGIYSSKFIFGGLFSGDAELWDLEAGLLIEARQMALLPELGPR
ncbi:MAG: thioesterase family protein [Acidimicrobiales bacterium]